MQIQLVYNNNVPREIHQIKGQDCAQSICWYHEYRIRIDLDYVMFPKTDGCRQIKKSPPVIRIKSNKKQWNKSIVTVYTNRLIYLKQIVVQRSGRGQLVYAHGIHSGFVVHTVWLFINSFNKGNEKFQL